MVVNSWSPAIDILFWFLYEKWCNIQWFSYHIISISNNYFHIMSPQPSDDHFSTSSSSSSVTHLACEAKPRTCGSHCRWLKLPQSGTQLCHYKTHHTSTINFHHLKTTVHFSVICILSLLLSRLGCCGGARQALRYNYPRDEVNFSLSQGMFFEFSFIKQCSSVNSPFSCWLYLRPPLGACHSGHLDFTFAGIAKNYKNLTSIDIMK